MEAISRNIIDVFIKMIQSLECPVCYEYVSSPIWQCEAGHILCNHCRNSIYSCPTCRRPFSSVRVRSLEQISDFMLFPCKNDGCEKILPLGEIQCHENRCVLENAFSRPDQHTRSTILQYNILKYIEQDIAPFLVTSRQTSEQTTQTMFERRNFKDASTMTDSISNLGNRDSSTLPETLKPNSTTSSQLFFPNSFDRNVIVPKKPVLPSQISFIKKNACQDKISNKTPLVNEGKKSTSVRLSKSDKLNTFFLDNDNKLISKKGSTKYDCYLQSTSSEAVQNSSAPPGFDFSPFIIQSLSSIPSTSQVSGFATFKFASNVSDAGTSNISGSEMAIVSEKPSLKSRPVFTFQASDDPSPESTNSLKVPTPNHKRRVKKSTNKNPSGFHFSSFLNALQVCTTEESRPEEFKFHETPQVSHTPGKTTEGSEDIMAKNSLTSSFHITTFCSCNTPITSTQSIRRPVMSSVMFGDITYNENFTNFKSLTDKVTSVFNSKTKNDQFIPSVTLPISHVTLSDCPVFSFSVGRSSIDTISHLPSSASDSSLCGNSSRTVQDSDINNVQIASVSSVSNVFGNVVKAESLFSTVNQNSMNAHSLNNSFLPTSSTSFNKKIDLNSNNTSIPSLTIANVSSTYNVSSANSHIFGCSASVSCSEITTLNCTNGEYNFPFSKPINISSSLPLHPSLSTTHDDLRNVVSDSAIFSISHTTTNGISGRAKESFPAIICPSLRSKCEVSPSISGPLFVSKIDSGQASAVHPLSFNNSPQFDKTSVSLIPGCQLFFGSSKSIQDVAPSSVNQENIKQFIPQPMETSMPFLSVGNKSSSSLSFNPLSRNSEQSNTLSGTDFSFSILQNDVKNMDKYKASESLWNRKTIEGPNSETSLGPSKKKLCPPSDTNSSSNHAPCFSFSCDLSQRIGKTPSFTAPKSIGSAQEQFSSVFENTEVRRPDSQSVSLNTRSVETVKGDSLSGSNGSTSNKSFSFDNPVVFSFASGSRPSTEPVSKNGPSFEFSITPINSQSLSVNTLFTFGRKSDSLWDSGSSVDSTPTEHFVQRSNEHT